jgi:hypothetical protein
LTATSALASSRTCFRATRVATKNRPADEHRMQLRYGSEESWHAEEHGLGFDVAGVDVTAVLGVHRDADVLIARDPARTVRRALRSDSPPVYQRRSVSKLDPFKD